MTTPITTTSSPIYSTAAANAAQSLVSGTTSTGSTTSSGYTPGSSTTSSAYPSSSTSSSTSGMMSLTPSDFINMMITQLQNQDPTQPTSGADILSQISQIGQLQASDTMQSSMQSLVLQDQLASASSFIGKSVQGLSTSNDTISGVVNSIHVNSGVVNLELDNGDSLPIGRVTDIDTGTAATTTGSSTSGTTSSGYPAATTANNNGTTSGSTTRS